MNREAPWSTCQDSFSRWLTDGWTGVEENVRLKGRKAEMVEETQAGNSRKRKTQTVNSVLERQMDSIKSSMTVNPDNSRRLFLSSIFKVSLYFHRVCCMKTKVNGPTPPLNKQVNSRHQVLERKKSFGLYSCCPV